MKKGVIPAHLRPYLFKKGQKKGRSTPKRTRTATMAKKRYGGRRSGGFGGMGMLKNVALGVGIAELVTRFTGMGGLLPAGAAYMIGGPLAGIGAFVLGGGSVGGSDVGWV